MTPYEKIAYMGDSVTDQQLGLPYGTLLEAATLLPDPDDVPECDWPKLCAEAIEEVLAFRPEWIKLVGWQLRLR